MVRRWRYTPPERRLADTLKAADQAVRNAQAPTGTEKGRVLQKIQESIARLENASQVFDKVAAGPWQGVVWASGDRSVSASSMSGRFRVSVHATAAGETSLFSFSAPGYPRDRILGASAAAAMARVSAFGGASAASSVYGSWVVELAPNKVHTFTAEGRGSGQSSVMEALGITVEPLL